MDAQHLPRHVVLLVKNHKLRRVVGVAGVDAHPECADLGRQAQQHVEPFAHGLVGVAALKLLVGDRHYALNWTRLSCKRFVSNLVRLALFRAGLQSGKLSSTICFAIKDQAMVPSEPSGEVDQNLLESCPKRSLHDLPDGRVAVSKDVFAEILAWISRLRCCTA